MSVLLVVLSVVGVASAGATQAKDPKADALAPKGARGGRIIFRSICISCHGGNAKGTGPLADSLTQRPADLTLIAKRHGGTFPAQWVAERIDGRQWIEQHGGASEMPVWGEGIAYAVPEVGLREERIRRAIDMLVEYLATIQE